MRVRLGAGPYTVPDDRASAGPSVAGLVPACGPVPSGDRPSAGRADGTVGEGAAQREINFCTRLPTPEENGRPDPPFPAKKGPAPFPSKKQARYRPRLGPGGPKIPEKTDLYRPITGGLREMRIILDTVKP